MTGKISDLSLMLNGGHAWVRIWQERPGEVSLECRCSLLWRGLVLNQKYGLVLPRCPDDAPAPDEPPGPNWDMKRCIGRLSGPPVGQRCLRKGWTKEECYTCFQHSMNKPERSKT